MQEKATKPSLEDGWWNYLLLGLAYNCHDHRTDMQADAVLATSASFVSYWLTYSEVGETDSKLCYDLALHSFETMSATAGEEDLLLWFAADNRTRCLVANDTWVTKQVLKKIPDFLIDIVVNFDRGFVSGAEYYGH